MNGCLGHLDLFDDSGAFRHAAALSARPTYRPGVPRTTGRR